MNMDTIAILSALLIGCLFYAIYHLTTTKKVDVEINRLVKTHSPEQLYDKLATARNSLNWHTAGGGILTLFFALIFFGAGGLDPREWGFENYAFALGAIVVTGALTMGQRLLYTNLNLSKIAIVITVLILLFIIYGEIATTSERGDSIVRERSISSPTLQAVVQNLKTPEAQPINTAGQHYADAAKWQSLADSCSGHCKRKNQARADEYTQLAERAEYNYQQQLIARQQEREHLIQHSVKLEYNEQNHTAIVRLLSGILSASMLAALGFASLIFVIAFEASFHYAGVQVAVFDEALQRLGYTTKPNNKKRHLYKINTPTPPAETRNTEPTAANPTPPTPPQQSSRDTAKSSESTPPHHSIETLYPQLYEHFKNSLQNGQTEPSHAHLSEYLKAAVTQHNLSGNDDEIIHQHATRMLNQLLEESIIETNLRKGEGQPDYVLPEQNLAYRKELGDQNYEVRGDEPCTCPNCFKTFTKSAWNQKYCSRTCKDNMHNILNPDRLKAARGAV